MVIIDTDLVVGVLRGNPEAIAHLRTLENPCITSITAFELLRGAYSSKNPQAQRELMIQVIESMFVIDFSYFDADRAGQIDVDLEKKGNLIGTLDVMIAATCLTKNMPLVTRNKKHFEKIHELKIQSW